jgi:phosphate-selective porin OprO/OprP
MGTRAHHGKQWRCEVALAALLGVVFVFPPHLTDAAEPLAQGIDLSDFDQLAFQVPREEASRLSEERPILAPDQPGNIRAGAGQEFESGLAGSQGAVLDPNQVGNIRERLNAIEGSIGKYPLIRLSGFFQLEDGLYSQSAASVGRYGDMQDGVGFRRTRLQAIGELSEFTAYTIELDFSQAGRPSLFDVWGEIDEIPWFGTIRIGQFRQPGLMDSWTSVRHLDFLERSAAFQAVDPFRRLGIMSYGMSESERTQWAASVYATGLTFWDGQQIYRTFGDNRYGAQLGDNGGVSFGSRISHLLYYDEPSEGRYLLHVGTGFVFSELGGAGDSLNFGKTYNAAVLPEFFIGDPDGGGVTAAGTPFVLSAGRILANNFCLYHLELAGNYGPVHFQSEAMLETINQQGGPTILLPTAYMQGGVFLTGEKPGYLKQAGVFDYNVVPHTPFFGTGRHGHLRGWGAWELACRWSYVDMSMVNVNPANQIQHAVGPPPSPNYGVLNESTVGVNWWWNRNTRLQFNWIHSMPDLVGYGPAPFDIFGTRFQIEF